MTGAEFRVMRFTNIALTALMLAITAGSAQASTSVTKTLTINVTFIQPSCDIKVPAYYNLGTLTPGGPKEHPDFNITWTCEGNIPLKTALTAGVVTGTVEGSNKDKVYMMSGGQKTGALLSLKEKGATLPIKLTGSKDYFCSDANAVAGVVRTCTLTPVTEVSQQGPFGAASTTLRFEVGYP